MPSLTVENYLKAILQIGLREGVDWVSAGQVGSALGVSPGTVTSMHQTLGEADLVEYRPYEGVCLTEAGQTLGMRMLRRHRLIEHVKDLTNCCTVSKYCCYRVVTLLVYRQQSLTAENKCAEDR